MSLSHARLIGQAASRLRGFKPAKALKRAFVGGCKREGFRICQFSVQESHIHLICEAKDRHALARGIQGFKVRVARALNKGGPATLRPFTPSASPTCWVP